jgi:hypothetical protein
MRKCTAASRILAAALIGWPAMAHAVKSHPASRRRRSSSIGSTPPGHERLGHQRWSGRHQRGLDHRCRRGRPSGLRLLGSRSQPVPDDPKRRSRFRDLEVLGDVYRDAGPDLLIASNAGARVYLGATGIALPFYSYEYDEGSERTDHYIHVRT